MIIDRDTATRTPPRAVTVSRLLLTLVAISHLVVPVVLVLGRGRTQDQIAGDHPDYDADTLKAAVDVAVGSAAVFHGILLLLTVFLVVKLSTGRAWVRRLCTGSQLVAVLFSVVSWQSSTMFHAVIPVLDLAQVAAVVLLWVPSSRLFFMRSPQH